MKILTLVVALALMSGSAMARKYAWEPGYDRAVAEREDAEDEERQLRMKLMEEQRELMEDQKRTMRSQREMNELQTLRMLEGGNPYPAPVYGVPSIGY